MRFGLPGSSVALEPEPVAETVGAHVEVLVVDGVVAAVVGQTVDEHERRAGRHASWSATSDSAATAPEDEACALELDESLARGDPLIANSRTSSCSDGKRSIGP